MFRTSIPPSEGLIQAIPNTTISAVPTSSQDILWFAAGSPLDLMLVMMVKDVSREWGMDRVEKRASREDNKERAGSSREGEWPNFR